MDGDLERNQSLVKEFQDLLYPEGHLVAVKLLKGPEIEGLGKVRHPEVSVVFCAVMSQVRYFGRTRLVGADDQACYAFGDLFGMKEMPKEVWKRYVGWQFKTEEASRSAFETVRKLPMGTCDAVLPSPLERCPVAPDVVVFCGNASQMLAIITGYLFDKGGTFTMQSNNQCSCSGIIVAAMLDREPKIIIPGNAWRLMGLPSVAELACGIPGNLLEGLAENMRFLKTHGGSQYPPSWPHIQWEPQPPIADILKPDGGPSWIKR
jgi:uncharacterized protein (DUF169 family)